MGYDSENMVERGVLLAEDQDPFGHVMHTQYMHFLGTCFHRIMESYAEYMIEDGYENMITGQSTVPVVRKYELDIRRQFQYPDAVSCYPFG
jgi:acyl-CoA thioesterase FadM